MKGTTSRQIVQEFQADVIAPVEVFHHEQHGMFSRQSRQVVGQDLKVMTLLLLGIEYVLTGQRRFIRKHVAEFRKQGEKSLGQWLDIDGQCQIPAVNV